MVSDPAGDAVVRVPLDSFSVRGSRRAVSFEYGQNERTFGCGEKAGRLDHRGRVMRFWNTDSVFYGRNTDPLYKSIPFWIGVRDGVAHGVLLDNPGRVTLDCGAWDPQQLRVRVETGSLDLYVIPGPDPLDVVRRYTALTGRPALPPRWALGFHQCRYSYRPAARVVDLARQFRAHDIPCDAIWLDIHYMYGFRSFTFDPVGFPDPTAMVSTLHDDGFRVVAMIDPGISVRDGYHVYASGKERDVFVKLPDGSEGRGLCWPGPCAYPDFLSPVTREWWGSLYEPMVEHGIDGYWNDMNEPSVFDGPGGTFPDDAVHQTEDGPVSHDQAHNAYGHEMVRATREGLEQLQPDRRPFVLTRAAYAGSQRYAAAWSGDNVSTWDDLRHCVPMALNMAASGFVLYGPDLGGFGGAPSPELFVRWLQAGAHLGLMRVHSCLDTPDQEPWSYGEPWTEHAREAIRTRYRLLSYTYSLVHEAAETGTPMVRALWMQWPQIPHLATAEDRWMLGPGLLVAPVLEAGVTRKTVPLPPGRWYTFPEGRPVRLDGCDATIDAPLDKTPVLARGGAIVPWDRPGRNADDTCGAELRIKVFAGGGGEFTLVEDDGDGAADAATRRTTFRLHSEPLHQVLSIDAPEGEHPGNARWFHVELLGLSGPPDQIMRDGEPEPAREHPATSDDAEGWAWDDERYAVRLCVQADQLPTRVELSHPPLPTDERKPVLVATRVEDPAAPWPTGGLRLEGHPHTVQSPWWTARDISVTAQARWHGEGLQVCCRVAGGPDERPDNDQEDGVQMVLSVPDGAVRIRVDWDAQCWVREGLYWAPHSRIKAQVADTDGQTEFLFQIPAAILGAQGLAPGLSCAFDLGVQRSDAAGGRAAVQWVRALSAPDRPGGQLTLV